MGHFGRGDASIEAPTCDCPMSAPRNRIENLVKSHLVCGRVFSNCVPVECSAENAYSVMSSGRASGQK